jgi:hypothetical protein
MGVLFENCKGSVHAFTSGGGGLSEGFYTIEPAISETSESRALIMSVTFTFAEIVQPTTTLDDKRILYLFGTAWNDMSIMGVLLLGDHTTKGAQLSKLLSWYNENRVSESKKSISVSLGDAGLEAYVVGLSLGEADPIYNKQPFVIRLLTADVRP